MKTEYEINAAINAAELAVTPLAADNAPVTVSHKTLLTLIEAAKRCLEVEADCEVP